MKGINVFRGGELEIWKEDFSRKIKTLPKEGILQPNPKRKG